MRSLGYSGITKEQMDAELDKVLKLNTKRLLTYYKKYRERYFRNKAEYNEIYFNLDIDNFFKVIREELARREHIEY